MKIEGQTIQEAVGTLKKLRRYAPYRFGGKWFIIENEEGRYEAFRTKCKAVKNAIKAWEFG